LTASGYNNIETKVLEPKPPNTAHAHDYDIYGLVTEGTFIVWLDREPATFKAGQVFAGPGW
jgi:quercetin dioxygenase-like cupin family protein